MDLDDPSLMEWLDELQLEMDKINGWHLADEDGHPLARVYLTMWYRNRRVSAFFTRMHTSGLMSQRNPTREAFGHAIACDRIQVKDDPGGKVLLEFYIDWS